MEQSFVGQAVLVLEVFGADGSTITKQPMTVYVASIVFS